MKSQIYGETAASQIAKKAIAQRLLKAYGDVGQRYLPEDKALGRFKVQLAFRDDRLQLRLDCTGAALHKRGYRQLAGPAPLRETLAASFLSLMRFKPFSDELLWDPCCGSGTIAIEAAMIAANMAPGLRRRFACEVFPFFSTKAIVEARNRAKQELDLEAPEQPFIFASDIDPELLDLASENAKKFGLENFIRFFRSDFCRPYDSVPRILDQAERCLIISNPPYGLRISDQRSVRELHYAFRKRCFNSDGLKPSYRLGLITSSKDLEEDLAQPADKRRKLYNGMIEACFYQWFKHPRVARNA
ncbi:MAG: class I SAM-dependent RNA methyltransferase [Eubacteriales bacterium]|nr:class I SAM-dependent RNA methyltransferase [Eubacteriales bacterium]